MDTLAFKMALAGVVVVMGSWISYVVTIPRNKVPVRPSGWIFMQCLGIGLAIAAILLRDQSSGMAVAAVIIPAFFAMMMGLIFLWLLTQRRTPIGQIKVNVGDKLLPFEATTSEGVRFHTDELAGKRVLMKFFRGGW